MLASELLGRTAYDRAGRRLGRVADLIARPGAAGAPVVTAVLVTPRWRGRLLGYERPGMQGPWALEMLSRLLHRGTREIALADVRLRGETDTAQ
jgi:hypothetical protein